MTKQKFMDWLSVASMVITTVGVAYAGLATIWHWDFSNEVYQSAVVISAVIASILGGGTVKKMVDNNHNGIDDSLEVGYDTTAQPYVIDESVQTEDNNA